MTDEQLLTGFAKSGSMELFGELYCRCKSPIGLFLHRHCHNQHLVDDLIQETFLIVLRKAGTYRGESKALTWIATIARNRLLTSRRISKYQRQYQPNDQCVMVLVVDYRRGPHDEAADSEERQRLHAAIDNELPGHTAEAIRVLDVEGLDYSEASERLHVPVGTLKSGRHRGLQLLKKALAA